MTIASCTLAGIQFDRNKDSFISFEDTTFLRGFWCIIVVLVHVPADFQNKLQDMMGSFAYIGVTFFFLTSAYGLKYKLSTDAEYIRNFWRRRLPSLLFPALIANAFVVTMKALNGDRLTVFSYFKFNNWVKVLLLMYFAFWIIYGVLPKTIRGGYWQDIVMVSFVAACSLIDRLTIIKITSIWVVEPLGFAYGIIIANHKNDIERWLKKRWLLKTACLLIASGLLGVAYLKYKPVLFIGDYLLKIVLGIAITAFIFSFIFKFRVGNSVNNFLGKISYEVYLIHGGVFALLMAVFDRINSGVFIATSVAVTIIIATLLNRLSKKLLILLKARK